MKKKTANKLFESKFQCRRYLFIDSSLDDLIEEIVSANNRGVSLEKNGSAVPSWSFGQSFFFSSTVVTTIGKIFFKVFWRSII